MSNTIFITGTSSGIGKATVQYFAQKGWNVAATMRSPEKGKELAELSNVNVYQLDVTDENSINQAVAQAIQDFGKIDVVLNNAGYGLIGPFELATKEQVQREFQTNLFGAMNVMKAFLPHFKQNKDGLIINLTSVGGLITMPYTSLYHSTKFALEGFSESLAYELGQFGIRIKIVEPGVVYTNFASSSLDMATSDSIKDYDADLQKLQQAFKTLMDPEANALGGGSTPGMVADTIFTAATDGSEQIRYLSGKDAEQMIAAKKEQGDVGFQKMMMQMLLGKGA